MEHKEEIIILIIITLSLAMVIFSLPSPSTCNCNCFIEEPSQQVELYYNLSDNETMLYHERGVYDQGWQEVNK